MKVQWKAYERFVRKTPWLLVLGILMGFLLGPTSARGEEFPRVEPNDLDELIEAVETQRKHVGGEMVMEKDGKEFKAGSEPTLRTAALNGTPVTCKGAQCLMLLHDTAQFTDNGLKNFKKSLEQSEASRKIREKRFPNRETKAHQQLEGWLDLHDERVQAFNDAKELRKLNADTYGKTLDMTERQKLRKAELETSVDAFMSKYGGGYSVPGGASTPFAGLGGQQPKGGAVNDGRGYFVATKDGAAFQLNGERYNVLPGATKVNEGWSNERTEWTCMGPGGKCGYVSMDKSGQGFYYPRVVSGGGILVEPTHTLSGQRAVNLGGGNTAVALSFNPVGGGGGYGGQTGKDFNQLLNLVTGKGI